MSKSNSPGWAKASLLERAIMPADDFVTKLVNPLGKVAVALIKAIAWMAGVIIAVYSLHYLFQSWDILSILALSFLLYSIFRNPDVRNVTD